MASDERRQSTRIACEVPVRILTDLRVVMGLIVDCSRSGVRVRIPGRSLGVHRLSSLVQVARRVSNALGQDFVGELHYEMLGSMVRKSLHPMRIGQRDWETPDVELGCRFGEPLTDAELQLLGIELPARETYVNDPQAALAMQEHPIERLRAFVYPGDGRDEDPIVTRPTTLDADTATLRVPDIARLGFDSNDLDLASMIIALDEAYGSRVSVKIVDGGEHLWTGQAGVRQVELPEDLPGQMLISVDFTPELGSADLRKLGIAV